MSALALAKPVHIDALTWPCPQTARCYPGRIVSPGPGIVPPGTCIPCRQDGNSGEPRVVKVHLSRLSTAFLVVMFSRHLGQSALLAVGPATGSELLAVAVTVGTATGGATASGSGMLACGNAAASCTQAGSARRTGSWFQLTLHTRLFQLIIICKFSLPLCLRCCAPPCAAAMASSSALPAPIAQAFACRCSGGAPRCST